MIKYKRVLLKISGEAFTGDSNFGIDVIVLKKIAKQIKEVIKMGVEVGIVVGGGNFWRGSKAEKDGMDRVNADYAGMLATIINALALQDVLEKEGIITRTQSAMNIQQVAETYIRRRAIRHLEKGRVVIFAAGAGNPYMTTDTAAALRAIEIGAEILLMAKNNIDGVYSDDPLKNHNSKKFSKLTYLEALNMHLKVIDSTALSLCLENKLSMIVFGLQVPNSIKRVVSGDSIGTFISSG